MEPQEYLTVLRKRWVMIVAVTLIGGAIAFAYASTLPTLYRSTSSVFVSSQRGETSSEILQGSNFTQAQVQSYAQLASLPQVLDPVIDRLDLAVSADQLAGSVTADIRLNTVIIDISVSSRSPTDAARIADAVTDSLSEVAEALSPQTEQGAAITMTTVAPARVPGSAYAPNTRLIVASGLLGGLVLAVGGALARELLDTRMRTRRDFERITDVPLLGTVARRARGENTLVMFAEFRSRFAEDHRRIATNLDFADIDEPVRSVVVTSATEAEGKTTNSINLALAMSERVQRVLLIDADLRRPSVAASCGIEGSVGLTSVLLGTATLEDAIRSWAGGTIDVMPSGVLPANPGQILGSESMAVLMNELLDRYDFVVVDSPPLLPVIDAVTISKLVDGAVIVVRSGATRRQQVVDALLTLEGVSTTVFGIVLNGVPARTTPAYYGQGTGGPERRKDTAPSRGQLEAPEETTAAPEHREGTDDEQPRTADMRSVDTEGERSTTQANGVARPLDETSSTIETEDPPHGEPDGEKSDAASVGPATSKKRGPRSGVSKPVAARQAAARQAALRGNRPSGT